MPYYEYICKKGHETERFYRIADRRDTVRCSLCRGLAKQAIPKQQQIRTFKPYIEENFDGTPIEITNKDQREALCKKHSLTYDSYKHCQKKRPMENKSAVEDVELNDVKRAIESGRTSTGEKLDRPVEATESLD